MLSAKAQGKRKLVEEIVESDKSDSEEEDLLKIVDESDSEDESDLGDALQQELLDEAELERELQEEEQEQDSESDSDSELSLDGLLEKHTSKPAENFDGDDKEDLQEYLDYDARAYKDRRQTSKSEITGQDKFEWDEIVPGYDSASDAEDPENRVGNIPSFFYDDIPHIGYDIEGKRVLKPAKGDELDKFLATVDGTAWTSVEDKTTGKNVELTDAELDLIHRLAMSENPDANYDPYEPTNEWYSRKTLATPVVDKPEPKRRFIPSKWEHKKVMKIVAAIRSGRIVSKPANTQKKLQFFNIWSDADTARADHPMHMPAPKMKLPSHVESYNPPAEYLFTEQERKDWLAAEPSDRVLDFIPQKHSALRLVPGYADFVKQRFDRCLDLYLAPRSRKRRPKPGDPQTLEDLMPKLPSPSELRPFPTACVNTYAQPGGVRTRSISIDPSGNWIVTGSEDGCVRLFELATGRCTQTWRIGQHMRGDLVPVTSVEWSPQAGRLLFAATVENKILLISPTDLLSDKNREDTLAEVNAAFNAPVGPDEGGLRWLKGNASQLDEGILIQIDVPSTPKQVTWHRKGDYFATVSQSGGQAVLIHQISKHKTQSPFKRLKGNFQAVCFHPQKPHFYVALQREVRLYDLMAQSLVKVLQPGVQMISSLDIHSSGDHVIVGSYDKKLCWHDLDLSDRPYKTLRHHSKAVRSVAFSPTHPLFFSAADDGNIHIFHASVYSDLVTEPLIVPLKVLRGHQIKENLGILSAKWHPKEPWIVSCGADGVARLWAPEAIVR